MSWLLGNLKDIAEVISGYAFKSTWFDEGVDKVIRIGDLQEGKVNLQKAKTFDSSVHTVREQFRIRSGDILMALSGATVGKIAVADRKCAGAYLNQRVAIIRAKQPESASYTKYIFSGNYLDTLLLNAGGAAQPNLSPKDLLNMQIPLPPIDEQKRIAAILDKADAIRQKRKQAIDLADEFLCSVFLDMFGDPVANPKGWEFSTLNNFGSFKNGMNFSKDEVGNQLYCVGVGDFKSFDRICGTSRLSTINLNEIPDKGYLLKDNDLLFVRSNGNKALVGRCVTVHPGAEEVTFSGFCIRYRIELVERLDADFVNYCLRIPSMKHAMLKGGQGANIQNINQQILSNLQIPIPPIELQKKYATLVASFRALQEKLTSNQLAAQEAFNSLSQKAFSGQL
ncbi:restriction endonuclease subunit S [Photobacterium damselae]|uniref:restriction endonuclease subunit S n=1 Tax=Photobacterium damselae TaxID=38293 RepID=UPI001EFD5C21|nr:restriction endonuclease subunit S [Photobacterium damselae]MCG9706108.1 restriction endonuclease subunit S [Photobacterium damselae]